MVEYPPTVSSTSGLANQTTNAKPPVSWQSRLSSHEFCVSAARTDSTWSTVLYFAASASSSDTIIASSVGGSSSCIRPSSVTSKPRSIATVSSAVVCSSSNVVKRTPAASQNAPRSGGMSVPISVSSSIGSLPPPPVIACTSGNVGTSAGSRGVSRRRFRPAPAATPVMNR